jgi:uncharacterized protein YndB with AHSA1/START domain
VADANELVKEIRIKATPETIFPFFTDPQKMMQWKGTSVELDPSPGGIYRSELYNGFVSSGEYVSLDPPHRVVFTFGWEVEGNPITPGSTTVEVTLTPDGDETIVRLCHSGLPDEQARIDHGRGWDHYLDRLAIAAVGGDAGPDQGLQAREN